MTRKLSAIVLILIVVFSSFPVFSKTKTIKAQVVDSEVGANDIATEYEQSSEIKDKYELKNASLERTADKGNMEVKVGDETLQVFEPSIELEKWQGEARFKMTPHLKSSTLNEKDVSFSGDKIIYKNDIDEEVHFYEKPNDILTPEGGFEIEMVLHSKPVSPVITFDIETENLEFQYQAPLNEKEQPDYIVSCTATECINASGTVMMKRPENVVGSYAVYHSSKKDGAYKTGKFTHIYRPELTDGKGNKSWGILSYTPGVLSIKIPDSIYNDPKTDWSNFRIDPTLGYAIPGASLLGFNADSLVCGTSSASVSTTITSIHFYGQKGTTNLGARGALYAATGTFVSTTTDETSINSATAQWWNLTVGAANKYITTTANTVYYICIFSDYSGSVGDNVSIAYDSITPSRYVYKNSGLTYPNWPATTTFITLDNSIPSIYASYGESAMMFFVKAIGNPDLFFWVWDEVNKAWGNENQPSQVSPGQSFIRAAISRTRNEALLATLDNNSSPKITVQQWQNGVWSATTTFSTLTASSTRPFDLAYETNSDNALIVYNENNAADPVYRTWSGTSSTWSGTTTIDMPNSGTPRWIELESNPATSSNEIVIGALDTNGDLSAASWTGTSTTNMGTTTALDTNVGGGSGTQQAFDIAYENSSHKAMIVWPAGTLPRLHYITYNGSTITPSTTVLVSAMGGTGNWIRCTGDYASSTSNNIMCGVLDSGNDLNTRFWNGSAWDAAHTEHTAGAEDGNSLGFDIVWDPSVTSTGIAHLVYGAASESYREYWSSTSSTWQSGNPPIAGRDTSYIDLAAIPNTSSPAVFIGDVERGSTSPNKDILEWHLTDGSLNWSATATVWGGPTANDPVKQRLYIATKPFQWSVPATSAPTTTPTTVVRRRFIILSDW